MTSRDFVASKIQCLGDFKSTAYISESQVVNAREHQLLRASSIQVPLILLNSADWLESAKWQLIL